MNIEDMGRGRPALGTEEPAHSDSEPHAGVFERLGLGAGPFPLKSDNRYVVRHAPRTGAIVGGRVRR